MSVTTIELPGVYAKCIPIFNVAIEPLIFVSPDVESELYLSPGRPVGPVSPFCPVGPVVPVGPSIPSKLTLYAFPVEGERPIVFTIRIVIKPEFKL